MTENPQSEEINAELSPEGEETLPVDTDSQEGGNGSPPNALHPSLEELVLEHERQFVDLGNMVADLGNAVQASREENAGKFGVLGTAVSEITESVKKLTERPKASEPDEWNSKHLPGPDAGELLDKVRDWVDWYNARYGTVDSIRIRGCWYLHPPVVEEITALWVAWRAAYYGHNKPDTAATYWHSAYLWPTIKRIRDEDWGMKNCTNGHKDRDRVLGASTDTGYTALRAALNGRTDTPVIPWPGQKAPAPAEPTPETSPIPVQRPTFGAVR